MREGHTEFQRLGEKQLPTPKAESTGYMASCSLNSASDWRI